MVEFSFDLKPLFPEPIIRVNTTLLPHHFQGDRHKAKTVSAKIKEIIDRFGALSAKAQRLTTPITTSQKLDTCQNQTVYLLADVHSGRNGCVLGLLKVGRKDLYLFDGDGKGGRFEKSPCILDFYVHESRQRHGCGKQLFEKMLAEELWSPDKCSIDRPSEKMINFMKKHYGLEKPIVQANNFITYQGIFSKKAVRDGYGGGCGEKKNQSATLPKKKIAQMPPIGRYAARKPASGVADLLYGTPAKRV